ncbi:MAG: phenylacetate--CoA ligase [Actinobacteria bacterium]|nr:phenylacetate--CoA ligase [Actinomycetota bacterium]
MRNIKNLKADNPDLWDPEVSTASREKIRALQLKNLRQTLKHCYENNVFYKNRIDEAGFDPDKVSDLSDIEKLPFTTKEDLRVNYPFGLFCTPLNQVIRVHSSSGTTGNPTVVGYTKEDLEIWAQVLARIMYDVGVRKEDIVQVSHGFGLFTGGFGFQYAAEKIGAMVIPVSGGNTERQLKIMNDFKSTVLCCTPSYTLFMAEVADRIGIDFSRLELKLGFLGAEPWSEPMRNEIEKRLCIKALNSYGLSEVIGPGVSCECLVQDGLHLNEDHFLAEIIDPDTGKNLPPGEKGEIVFTTLTKKAFPVIRYRTKDISYLYKNECSCGKTFMKMSRPMGRTDDMLIIRGVNVFPSQIEEVLMNIKDLEPHYLIVLSKENYLDKIEVWVEVSENIFQEKLMDLEFFEKSIENRLYSAIGIHINVSLKEPKTIARSEGKAQRVWDRRQEKN